MCRMENANDDETRPTPVGDETIPTQPEEETTLPSDPSETVAMPVPPDQEPGTVALGGRSLPIRWLLILSLVSLLAIAAASAFGGYMSGINLRTGLEATQVAQEVAQQFSLGVQDLEARRYEVARQRFEYVIRLDPGYPGVTEKLAEVLLELNTTATPTVVPTPTLTPTPDMRTAEELFSQAQVFMADEQWSEAIDALLKLRKDEPGYQPVKVDSMLYVSLRNRGVHRILNEADLEGGTYDLALAERFGPLDIEASNMRTWADLYVTGASFWGLDWAQSAYYFGQLLQVAPNLRDSSNLTATERFRTATIKYADTLAENGDWCLAQEQYDQAFNYGTDPAVEPTAQKVAQECEQMNQPEEEPTEEPPPAEATPTPGEGYPAPQETPASQETPTPEATAPYPTP